MAVEILQSTGKLGLRVTGSSMLPTLWPGDVLHFQSSSPRSIQPGMIVLCRRNDKFVVHRLARHIESEGRSEFITRGDAMDNDDPPVPASDVLGCLVSVQRRSETLSSFFGMTSSQKLLGWLLCRSALLHRLALRWHAGRFVAAQDVAH
jgi:signal peptidase